MTTINFEAENLLEQIKPELLKAFSTIPEYGSLGFTVHLNEKEPVRIEWSSIVSRRLLPVEERGGK